MEHVCSSCEFHNLDRDTFPCKKCSRWFVYNDTDYWVGDINHMTDSSEMLRMILRNQVATMKEISKIKKYWKKG